MFYYDVIYHYTLYFSDVVSIVTAALEKSKQKALERAKKNHMLSKFWAGGCYLSGVIHLGCG